MNEVSAGVRAGSFPALQEASPVVLEAGVSQAGAPAGARRSENCDPDLRDRLIS